MRALPSGVRAWLLALAGGSVYYLAGVLGLSLSFVHSSVSPVWPPTGVAMGVLAVLGLRHWPVFLLGAFLFNLRETPWEPSLAIAAGNTLEGLLGAWVLRRMGNEAAFSSAPSAFAFLGIGGLLAPALSATIGTTTLVAAGLAPQPLFGTIWLTWWLGDAGGALVVAPLIVLWASASRLQVPLRDGLIGLAASVAAAYIAFGAVSGAWGLVALLPILVWSILYLGPRITASNLLLIATTAVAWTVRGEGPFFHGDENEALLLLQLFLGFTSAISLLLAAGRSAMAEVEGRDHDLTMGAATARWLPVTLCLLPLLLASILGGGILQESRVAAVEARTEAHEDAIAGTWEARWRAEEGRLLALQGLFASTDSVSRDAFTAFIEATHWIDGPESAQAVGFNRIVAADDIAAFEAERQTEFGPAYHVHPDTGLPQRHVVDYLVPIQGNEAAFGLDVNFEATRQDVIRRALASDTAVTSAPIELVQGEPGVLTMLRIPAPDDASASIGIVVSVHRIQDLADAIDARLAAVGVDATFSVHPEGPSGPGYGEHDARDADNQGTFQVPGGAWTFYFADPAGVVTRGERAAPWASLVAGGVMSLAFAAVVYAYDNTRRQAYALADAMTAQIRSAERASARAERHAAELERMRRVDRFKNDFINMAAHELRTPLVPLRAQLYILRRHGLFDDPQLQGVMKVVHRNVDRMATIVEDLLQSARLQADQVHLDRTRAALEDLLRSAVDSYRPVAADAGVALAWRHTGHPKAYLDPARIAQVLDNLLSNAIKFTPSGGRIDVTSHADDTGWECTVQDSGRGIAPKALSQLFEPFTMVHDPNEITAPGSGLGLYICRSILTLHNGGITASSPGLGRGATFRFFVPHATPPDEEE